MKMYVLVRTDLYSCAYSAVQAGHALAEYMIDYPNNVGEDGRWENGTLIYLGVPDEETLRSWYDKLCGYDVSAFWEPDIGLEMTAVCALDYPDHRLQELFKDLPLL